MDDFVMNVILFMCATAAWVGLLILPGAPSLERKFDVSRRLKIGWAIAVLVAGFIQIGLGTELLVIGRPLGVQLVLVMDVVIISFFTVLFIIGRLKNKTKQSASR